MFREYCRPRHQLDCWPPVLSLSELLAGLDITSKMRPHRDYFWADPNPFPKFILFPRLARLERKVKR